MWCLSVECGEKKCKILIFPFSFWFVGILWGLFMVSSDTHTPDSHVDKTTDIVGTERINVDGHATCNKTRPDVSKTHLSEPHNHNRMLCALSSATLIHRYGELPQPDSVVVTTGDTLCLWVSLRQTPCGRVKKAPGCKWECFVAVNNLVDSGR